MPQPKSRKWASALLLLGIPSNDALKLTPVHQSTQRVDIASEARALSNAFMDAYNHVKVGSNVPADESSRVEYYATLLHNRAVKRLESSINRWILLEEKMKLSMPHHTSAKYSRALDEVANSVAAGKALLGRLYFQSNMDSKALTTLQNACPVLMDYDVAIKSLYVDGWLDCLSSLGELHVRTGRFDLARTMQADVLSKMSWLKILVSKSVIENAEGTDLLNLPLFSYLSSMSAMERYGIAYITKNAWLAADNLREQINPLVGEFAASESKRRQLAIFVASQEIIENAVKKFSTSNFLAEVLAKPNVADETVHIETAGVLETALRSSELAVAPSSSESTDRLQQIHDFLLEVFVAELKKESRFYLEAMDAVIENGEKYLQEWRSNMEATRVIATAAQGILIPPLEKLEASEVDMSVPAATYTDEGVMMAPSTSNSSDALNEASKLEKRYQQVEQARKGGEEDWSSADIAAMAKISSVMRDVTTASAGYQSLDEVMRTFEYFYRAHADQVIADVTGTAATDSYDASSSSGPFSSSSQRASSSRKSQRREQRATSSSKSSKRSERKARATGSSSSSSSSRSSKKSGKSSSETSGSADESSKSRFKRGAEPNDSFTFSYSTMLALMMCVGGSYYSWYKGTTGPGGKGGHGSSTGSGWGKYSEHGHAHKFGGLTAAKHALAAGARRAPREDAEEKSACGSGNVSSSSAVARTSVFHSSFEAIQQQLMGILEAALVLASLGRHFLVTAHSSMEAWTNAANQTQENQKTNQPGCAITYLRGETATYLKPRSGADVDDESFLDELQSSIAGNGGNNNKGSKGTKGQSMQQHPPAVNCSKKSSSTRKPSLSVVTTEESPAASPASSQKSEPVAAAAVGGKKNKNKSHGVTPKSPAVSTAVLTAEVALHAPKKVATVAMATIAATVGSEAEQSIGSPTDSRQVHLMSKSTSDADVPVVRAAIPPVSQVARVCEETAPTAGAAEEMLHSTSALMSDATGSFDEPEVNDFVASASASSPHLDDDESLAWAAAWLDTPADADEGEWIETSGANGKARRSKKMMIKEKPLGREEQAAKAAYEARMRQQVLRKVADVKLSSSRNANVPVAKKPAQPQQQGRVVVKQPSPPAAPPATSTAGIPPSAANSSTVAAPHGQPSSLSSGGSSPSNAASAALLTLIKPTAGSAVSIASAPAAAAESIQSSAKAKQESSVASVAAQEGHAVQSTTASKPQPAVETTRSADTNRTGRITKILRAPVPTRARPSFAGHEENDAIPDRPARQTSSQPAISAISMRSHSNKSPMQHPVPGKVSILTKRNSPAPLSPAPTSSDRGRPAVAAAAAAAVGGSKGAVKSLLPVPQTRSGSSTDVEEASSEDGSGASVEDAMHPPSHHSPASAPIAVGPMGEMLPSPAGVMMIAPHDLLAMQQAMQMQHFYPHMQQYVMPASYDGYDGSFPDVYDPSMVPMPMPMQPMGPPATSVSPGPDGIVTSSEAGVVVAGPGGYGLEMQPQQAHPMMFMPHPMAGFDPAALAMAQQMGYAYPYYQPMPSPEPQVSDSSDVIAALRCQIEYYFSPANLCKDMYLRKMMDTEGFVLLKEIAQFRRILNLNASPIMLLEAVQSSPQLDVVELWAVRAVRGNPAGMAGLSDAAIFGTKIRCMENPTMWTKLQSASASGEAAPEESGVVVEVEAEND